MNPALWSTLPMELLQRVFANLPLPNICRLKSLSKEWKLSLQSSSSKFTLALKEFSPRMLARVTWGRKSNFWIGVLDGRNNRRHEVHVNTARGVANGRRIYARWWLHMAGAADAGLVCNVCKDFETGLNSIFVVNPMTGVVSPLPILNLLANSELIMMVIVVDRNTYQYKVIVVKDGPPVEAEVNDSEVQQGDQAEAITGAHFWHCTRLELS